MQRVIEFCRQHWKSERITIKHLSVEGNPYGPDIGIYEDGVLKLVVDSHVRCRKHWITGRDGRQLFKHPTVSILYRKMEHAREAWAAGLKIQHHNISPDLRTLMTLSDQELRKVAEGLASGEVRVDHSPCLREDGTLETTSRIFVSKAAFSSYIRTVVGLWVPRDGHWPSTN